MPTHGVTINEVPTGVRPPVRTTAGLPVYVGTGPINLGDPTCVNEPRVYYTMAEVEEDYGPLSSMPATRWSAYTLMEPITAHFETYGVGPIVLVNVLNPDDTDHTNTATGEVHLIGTDGTVLLETYALAAEGLYGILESTVVIKKAAVTMVEDTDYTLAFDEDGMLELTVVDGGALAAGDTITADFTYFDPTGVSSADIIGGYSAGAYTGLELVQQVYRRLRLVPGMLLAPKWSQTPSVAARMIVLARALEGGFKCTPVLDLSTDPANINDYSEAAAWKTANNYSRAGTVCLWPKVDNDDDTFHASTIFACIANDTDSDNDGIPFESPSNKTITATAIIDDDETEHLLTLAQANSLNGQGIVTFLNTAAGFKVWGNRTAIYPTDTDVKESMIPVRRMFDWIGNTVILTTERDVDEPGNRRLIDSVRDTLQTWLNGLVARGALVYGLIEFRSDDNPTTDLSDGIIRWHLTLTPPSPGESLEFTLEYDPTQLEALFE